MKAIQTIMVINLMLLSISNLCGQPAKYFVRIMSFDSISIFSDAIVVKEKNDSTYALAGHTIETLYNWEPFLIELNRQGGIIQKGKYHSDYPSGVRGMEITTGNYWAAGFSNVESLSNAYLCRFSADNVSECDCALIGPDNYPSAIYSIKESGSGYFLVGETEPNDLPVGQATQPYLIRLNELGEMVWDSVYYQLGTSGQTWFNDIQPAPDGSGYYICGSANWYWYASSDIILAKMDDNGNLLWQHTYDLGNVEFGANLINTLDGGIIVLISRTSEPGVSDGGVIKYDHMGMEQWRSFENYFVGASTGAVCQLKDSSIIIGGAYQPSAPASNIRDAEFIKLSPTGTFIRRVHYGGDYNDYIYDMIASSDGSIVACGRTELPGQSRIYFLKLNCMGLLTEPEAAFAALPQSDNVVMFENQSLYAYPDSIDGGHYIWDFGDGSPPFVCGQGFGPCPDLVQHTYPQSGTYHASLTAVVCSDTSVVSQAVSAVLVGLPVVEGAELGAAWVRVWPNPAHNTALIQYNIPTDKSGELLLYTTDGRCVKQIALSGKGQQELMLDNLPAGLYFYTVKIDSEQVFTERLIILK